MNARSVLAETLDGLAADDPAAVRSRRDLQRIHRAMGTRGILRGVLQDCLPVPSAQRPLRILELGAGDGTLLLGVAKRMARRWPTATVSLLDRQPLLSVATLSGYAALGWLAVMEPIDVFEWMERSDESVLGAGAARWDLIIANLFLHHFRAEELAPLMHAAARRCDRFVAVEPRRARLPLLASHLVIILGANSVTRKDAVLSVRAGFRDGELAGFWGAPDGGWTTREYPAGMFSHVFRASRLVGEPA